MLPLVCYYHVPAMHSLLSTIIQVLCHSLSVVNYFWKLLRYLSGIVASIFKTCTGGCGGYGGQDEWDPSRFCGGFGGPSVPGGRDGPGVLHYLCCKFNWFTIWSIIMKIINFVSIIIP